MERLTAKDPKGGYYVPCKVCPRRGKGCDGPDDCVLVLAKRLAAYEDTGLTPEEIQTMKVELEALRSRRIPVIRMRDEVKG